LTGDDEGRVDAGIVDVQDVPGTIDTEIHYLSSEACQNKEQAGLLPTTTCKISKSKSTKKRYLSDDLSEWSKMTPFYTNCQIKETGWDAVGGIDKEVAFVVT
jgi:hypothetical protein